MRARIERGDGSAIFFQHGLFARVHKHDARRKDQDRQLRQQQRGQVFFEQLEKPRLGNLEAELIIQRLRRRGEQAFRLREQADNAAVVKRPGDFAFDARAVDFQQQRDEDFRRHQAQQHAPRTRNPKIGPGQFRFGAGDAQRGEGADIRSRQQEARAWTQQSLAFEPRDGNRKPAHQKQQ
jgi:hypothetical protein